MFKISRMSQGQTSLSLNTIAEKPTVIPIATITTCNLLFRELAKILSDLSP